MRKENEYDEIGAIRKEWRNRIKIALIYPNTYSVGMSNLGFQTVYRLFNAMDAVVCERAFLPAAPDTGHTLRTIESSARLTQFDFIAFSLSFENDYLNIPAILKKTELPLRSDRRTASHPIIIAGGVACLLNPEPIAEFIDCFLLGEAEVLIPAFIKNVNLAISKRRCLEQLASQVDGIYVPAFFYPEYNQDGTLKFFRPIGPYSPIIKRQKAADIETAPACSAILTPNTTFKNTFLIETTRGCPHGCRFCSAGYIYRPPRFIEPKRLQEMVVTGRTHTSHIGLVGTAITDVPQIADLCYAIRDLQIDLSFSSLRADGLSKELITVLKSSRLKTATIAPDAGSERMRRVINKGLDEEQLLNAATALVSAGIPNLKLYFMIGLPSETMADIEAIVQLCRQIKERFLLASRIRKKIGTITVSVNAFIPKPFTPFQWAPMERIKSLKAKVKHLKKHLNRIPNLRLQTESPRKAYVQALLSRGDRRVSAIIEQAHNNNGNWPQTFSQIDLDTDFYVTRPRDPAELLPWDFIDHGLSKSFLLRERQRAETATPSAPCPMKSCSLCGVCKRLPNKAEE